MNNQAAADSQTEKDDLSRRKRFKYCIPKRCFFIQGILISNPVAELTAVGMLMTYLTDFREEKLIAAAATVNILEGVGGAMSVPACFLKDLIGCYSTIILTLLIYSMGLVLLCISTVMSGTNNNLKNLFMYMGLILIALGKAGYNSSCVEDYLEQQLKSTRSENTNSDHHKKRDKSRKKLLMMSSQTLGLVLVTALLAIVPDWRIRYGSCAALTVTALVVFLIGSPFYITGTSPPIRSRGSKKSAVVADSSSPASNDLDNGEDKEEGNRYQEVLRHVNKNQVKETNYKILVLMGPMCLTFLMYGTVKSTGSTFFLEQGNNMKGGESTGAALINLIIVMDTSGGLTKYLVALLLRNPLKGTGKLIATLIRIGLGVIFSITCCSVSQYKEEQRLQLVENFGLQDSKGKDDGGATIPMNVYWLLPQFICLGAMNGLAGEGMRDFFQTGLPTSMKLYASAFTSAVSGIGTLLGVLLVSIFAKASKTVGGTSWFADTINGSHLDRFYRALTIMCLINSLAYAYISTSYSYKRLPNEDSENLAQSRSRLEVAITRI